MRKYLLASAALLGLAAGSAAQAATFAPTDPSYNATAFGAPQTNPDPGKIIVRLGGSVWVDAGVFGSTQDKSHTTGAKNQPYGMSGLFRLYGGVDGKMNNGLIYGANFEMRTNFAGAGAGGYTNSGALSASGGTNSTASLWYTRRAYLYIGGDQFGIIRLGQGDGPNSLFIGNSTGEFYDTGHWDGDICDLVSGNACLGWPFPDTSGEYATNKIVWISPSWAGFNVGLSFAPSTAALSGNGEVAASTGGSTTQSVSTLTSDTARARNMLEVAARYKNTFGPFGVDGTVGYTVSDVVKGASAAAYPAGVVKYYGLNILDAGLTLSYSGVQAFGHITYGKYNGADQPAPKLSGRKNADSITWTAGLAYGQGPWIVGAGYYQSETPGSTSATGNRREVGVSVGGTYTLTPGLNLYLEYLYGYRHQSGVNFRDSSGPATADNKITTNALLGTIQVKW